MSNRPENCKRYRKKGKPKTILSLELEKDLCNKVLSAREKDLPFSVTKLQQEARKLPTPKVRFLASRSWWRRFKARHNLSVRRVEGKSFAKSFLDWESIEQVVSVLNNILITAKPDEKLLICNFDEAAQNFADNPKTTIAKKGEKRVFLKGMGNMKMRATGLFGSMLVIKNGKIEIKKSDLMVIFRGSDTSTQIVKKMKIPKNCHVLQQKNAWITLQGVKEFFQNCLGVVQNEKFDKKILLFDRCPAHETPAVLEFFESTGWDIIWVPAGATGVIQPQDLSVNKPMKDFMRKSWSNCLEELISKQLLAEGKEVTLPLHRQMVLDFMSQAWDQITEETIFNGWKEAGFFDFGEEEEWEDEENDSEEENAFENETFKKKADESGFVATDFHIGDEIDTQKTLGMILKLFQNWNVQQISFFRKEIETMKKKNQTPIFNELIDSLNVIIQPKVLQSLANVTNPILSLLAEAELSENETESDTGSKFQLKQNPIPFQSLFEQSGFFEFDSAALALRKEREESEKKKKVIKKQKHTANEKETNTRKQKDKKNSKIPVSPKTPIKSCPKTTPPQKAQFLTIPNSPKKTTPTQKKISPPVQQNRKRTRKELGCEPVNEEELERNAKKGRITSSTGVSLTITPPQSTDDAARSDSPDYPLFLREIIPDNDNLTKFRNCCSVLSSDGIPNTIFHEAQQTLTELHTKNRQNLENIGFHVNSIVGDGNCLFRAISHQICKDERFHENFRKECFKYIENNKQTFQAFIPSPIDEYIQKFRQNRAWCGEHELNAISAVYGVRIVLYKPFHPKPSVYQPPDYSDTIFISFFLNHYESLTLNSRTQRLVFDRNNSILCQVSENLVKKNEQQRANLEILKKEKGNQNNKEKSSERKQQENENGLAKEMEKNTNLEGKVNEKEKGLQEIETFDEAGESMLQDTDDFDENGMFDLNSACNDEDEEDPDEKLSKLLLSFKEERNRTTSQQFFDFDPNSPITDQELTELRNGTVMNPKILHNYVKKITWNTVNVLLEDPAELVAKISSDNLDTKNKNFMAAIIQYPARVYSVYILDLTEKRLYAFGLNHEFVYFETAELMRLIFQKYLRKKGHSFDLILRECVANKDASKQATNLNGSYALEVLKRFDSVAANEGVSTDFQLDPLHISHDENANFNTKMIEELLKFTRNEICSVVNSLPPNF